MPNKLCTRCEGCKEGGEGQEGMRRGGGGKEEEGLRVREREGGGGRVRICNRHEDICKAYYVILGMRDCTCHRLP